MDVEESMRLIFKQFEIRPINDTDFEVVKWNDEKCSTTCFTMAWLKWNKKEPCYEMNSCGTRFLRHYEDGLAEFLASFVDFQEKQRSLEEE